MGFWKTGRGIGGDSWADELGRCMKALSADPKPLGDPQPPVLEHEISMEDFADLVEFCTRGHLVVEVFRPDTDGGRPLSELGCWGVETYPNRGQIHCPEGE